MSQTNDKDVKIPGFLGGLKKFLEDKIWTPLTKNIEDITKLDTTTFVGNTAETNFAELLKKKETEIDDSIKKSGAQLVGFTRIDADGDVVEFLHASKKNEKWIVDEDLKQIHDENLIIAVETWNRFFRNLLEIAAAASAILAPNAERTAVLRTLIQNIEPLGKKGESQASNETDDNQQRK